MSRHNNWVITSEELAKVGYEIMHEDAWDELPDNSIERVMWRRIAVAMLQKLWQLYKSSKGERVI